MSPKFNHGVNNDMCAIPEESGMDLLSIPANECAAQLTAMDAVSANLLFVSNLLCLTYNLFISKGQLSLRGNCCMEVTNMRIKCMVWNTLETKNPGHCDITMTKYSINMSMYIGMGAGTY